MSKVTADLPAATAPADLAELTPRLEALRVELTALLLPDARLRVRSRGCRPGDVHPRLARRTTGSRAAPRSGRGCTGSRRTSASTCWAPRQRRARPIDLNDPLDRGCATRRAARGERVGRAGPRRPRGPERRRPGRRRRRARIDPAGVRRRAPAPAAEAARRADPARGPALAGRRGRGAARHDRRVGQQRAPAGPGDAGDQAGPRGERRSSRSTTSSRPCSRGTSMPSSATTWTR